MIDERKLIIGLITSTTYCTQIQPIWSDMYIESSTARRLSRWVWEYYDTYKKAPGKEIESIYYTKAKQDNLPRDIAEEIERDILPSLSNEYTEEGFNTEYYVKETERYFTAQHLRLHQQEVETLLSQGKAEEAETLATSFRPLALGTHTLDTHVLTPKEIESRNIKEPLLLMKPWLREGQITILYGNYGSGKSLLSIAVAYVLGLRDYKEDRADIAEWSVTHPTGTLYVDGELGQREMTERIKQFKWLGEQARSRQIKIFSLPEYQMETEDSFLLCHRQNQLKILRWLQEHDTYKLIVLDSISTLFGLEEENSNSEWNAKINPFLRDLRASGVATLLLHHAGKDNKRGLRGASAMGAMAHNIFRLTNHKKKDIDEGEAWFTLTKDKQRTAGRGFKEFSLRFYLEDDARETHWEVTENSD